MGVEGMDLGRGGAEGRVEERGENVAVEWDKEEQSTPWVGSRPELDHPDNDVRKRSTTR